LNALFFIDSKTPDIGSLNVGGGGGGNGGGGGIGGGIGEGMSILSIDFFVDSTVKNISIDLSSCPSIRIFCLTPSRGIPIRTILAYISFCDAVKLEGCSSSENLIKLGVIYCPYILTFNNV
jgi:hypothetical protein